MGRGGGVIIKKILSLGINNNELLLKLGEKLLQISSMIYDRLNFFVILSH